jgi:hypothetical protein
MLGAGTGNTARANLAAIGDVFAQSGYIFVIDIGNLITTK